MDVLSERSRRSRLTYPTSTSSYRLKLKYAYGYGILNKISDFNAAAMVFWEATAVDARGNVLQEALGNGLDTIRGFDAVPGRLDYVLAGPGGDGSRQDMEFSWNKVGSLTQRKDLKRSLTEAFSYAPAHDPTRKSVDDEGHVDQTGQVATSLPGSAASRSCEHRRRESSPQRRV